MSENTPKNSGVLSGIISCILAVIGMFTLGIVFIPIAVILALISSIISIKNKNFVGIGISVLAWILNFIGLMMSPLLLSAIGLATLN